MFLHIWMSLKVDATRRNEVNDMAERAIAAFGAVQFVFNSAGSAIRRAKFLDIDDALLQQTFALNVCGTFYAMQAVLPHMLANKHTTPPDRSRHPIPRIARAAPRHGSADWPQCS
jgi:NAD(P)-dependent dehydrogenase (short-subunit alcohol dehydrogenase family)